MTENTNRGGFTLTGNGITFFMVRRVITAYEMEARGMKMNRSSALQQAKMLGLVPPTCRTRRKGLQAAIAATKELLPTYEPSENVLKVLAEM